MSLFIRQDTLNSPLICFCLNHPFLFLPSSSLSLYKRLFTHAQTRRLSLFNSVPAASNAPAAMPPPLPSNTIIEYRCMHVRSSDAALVLHDSSAELRGEAGNAPTTWRAAFIIASPHLLMRHANIRPRRYGSQSPRGFRWLTCGKKCSAGTCDSCGTVLLNLTHQAR